MIVANNSKMVAGAAEVLCEPSVCSVQFNIPVPKSDAVLAESASVSIDVVSISENSAVSCAASIETRLLEWSPRIRSGSHTDIGPRKCNEDEHIRIDDLSKELGTLYKWHLPSSFYAVFDGHGGSEAASYLKNHATRLFFQDSDLPQTSHMNNALFLEEVENCHFKAFLTADEALANEYSISDYCGTTALTALIIGNHLLIANAGDCRAVICRKGVATQMSEDHRPSYLQEKKRVEALGGFIEDDYLNGELAVTRALGDWYMKTKSLPVGFESALTARPEVRQMELTEDDEFMIMGCDGIWDVMSNEEAVSIVRRQLRRCDDPERCARELVNQALRRHTTDNVTVIVVCFGSASAHAIQRPRFRCSGLTEEARDRLRNLLQGN